MKSETLERNLGATEEISDIDGSVKIRIILIVLIQRIRQYLNDLISENRQYVEITLSNFTTGLGHCLHNECCLIKNV